MRITPALLLIASLSLGILVNGGALYLTWDDWRRTPESIPRRASKISVLTFAGDIMAHDVNFYMPSYKEIYRDIRPLLKYDGLSFANLEFPVDESKPYQNYPRFNNHPSYVQAAVDAGFQVFSAANNHATDQGPESVLATRSYLRSLAEEGEVHWSGLRGHADDPMMPTTIELEGMRIGFLAVTLLLNIEEGSEHVYRINYRDAERRSEFLSFLTAIRPSYDLLILSVHGGVEYRREPLPFKSAWHHQLVDAGVDILWGHHPHVLQPHEIRRLPDGRRALIIHSAGNLISGQSWRMDPDEWAGETPPRAESALYRVRIVHRRNGSYALCGAETIPVVTYRHPEHGMIVRRYDRLLTDAGLSPAWREFYERREDVVNSVLRPYSSRGAAP